MENKDLLKRKSVKKQQKIKNSNLEKEIEKIRDELNRIVAGGNKIAHSEEVLEISMKLDELIVNYLKTLDREV